MKRAFLACFALVALTAIHGLAAEPAAESKADPKAKPSAKAAADAPKTLIPERKLTFDVSDEEQTMPFSVADPELLEQRYVTTFSLVGPRRLKTYREVSSLREAEAGYRVATDRHAHVLFYPISRQNTAIIKSVLREIPEERLPSENIVSLLTKGSYPSFSRVVRPLDEETEDDKYIIRFVFVTPTVERAKEQVQEVLSFYDYGIFYPLQREALAAKRAFEKRLPEVRASLEKSRDEQATLGEVLEDLKDFADISSEALVNFISQQRLIAVDLVGIRARIDACNKILADRANLSPNRIDQVETVKITAEIEMVGLAARKGAIEEIVKKGRERREAFDKRARASSGVRSREREISQISEGIAHYEAELKKCTPYPVEGGKVTIRRIKWVPPEKKD